MKASLNKTGEHRSRGLAPDTGNEVPVPRKSLTDFYPQEKTRG